MNSMGKSVPTFREELEKRMKEFWSMIDYNPSIFLYMFERKEEKIISLSILPILFHLLVVRLISL